MQTQIIVGGSLELWSYKWPKVSRDCENCRSLPLLFGMVDALQFHCLAVLWSWQIRRRGSSCRICKVFELLSSFFVCFDACRFLRFVFCVSASSVACRCLSFTSASFGACGCAGFGSLLLVFVRAAASTSCVVSSQVSVVVVVSVVESGWS